MCLAEDSRVGARLRFSHRIRYEYHLFQQSVNKIETGDGSISQGTEPFPSQRHRCREKN